MLRLPRFRESGLFLWVKSTHCDPLGEVMHFIDASDRADYARDIYAEVRNLTEAFRYRARNLINEYEALEEDVEALLLELASQLQEDDTAGGPDDPPAALEIPY